MIEGSDSSKELEQIKELRKKKPSKRPLQLERSKPRAIKSISNRTQDQNLESSDKQSPGINQLVNFALSCPFMNLFGHYAIQQNYQSYSKEKCIYIFATRHPRFYSFCKKSDYLLHTTVIIILVGLVLYSAIKILK